LLDKRLDEITGLDVEKWRASEIERGLSLETINRDISSIKAALNRAAAFRAVEVETTASSEDNASRCRVRSAVAPNVIPPITGGANAVTSCSPACERSCSPIM
jgi:hypothetical protein